MKKLVLNKSNFTGKEVLTRSQLKKILGGNVPTTGMSYTCQITCPDQPNQRYTSEDPCENVSPPCSYNSQDNHNYCTMAIVSNNQVVMSCNYSYPVTYEV